jgi:hypothetical protein
MLHEYCSLGSEGVEYISYYINVSNIRYNKPM